MDKENNRSAAGLRRSAIVERIRLREEWSALKGTAEPNGKQAIKKPNITKSSRKCLNPLLEKNDKRNPVIQTRLMPKRGKDETSDILRGIVALVEVGLETKALPLRAALAALGASVVPSWTPLVTHLVWTEGGCRATRSKARALACSLVSPLWVEACAAAARKLPEQAFPSAARPSDLPSPKSLQRLLKKADMENIPLENLLSDSKEDNDSGNKLPKLRISSDTDRDTSTDLSTDKSIDTSRDQSKDKTNIEHRVNTAPRRALPLSTSPTRPAKSRRKLFTQKEPQSDDDDDRIDTQRGRCKTASTPQKVPASRRRELARAERLARRLANLSTSNKVLTQHIKQPKIVLTGMSRNERHKVCNAIRELDGKIQSKITKKTTHVLLGSCRDDQEVPTTQEFNLNDVYSNMDRIFKETSLNRYTSSVLKRFDSVTVTNTDLVNFKSDNKGRTVNALVGAARGCRVLHGLWAVDSAKEKRWLHHHGYEVSHLRKICQKARIERTALGRSCPEYAYDVFCGMRVRISPDADHRDAAKQLLQLCGAIVHEGTQNGGVQQNVDLGTADFDVKIGICEGEISSKWVFDSVASARMRTTRRYVNKNISLDAIEKIG